MRAVVQRLMHEPNTYFTARDHDFCEGCKEDFARWMRREPTSVLQPKDMDPERPLGERIDWQKQGQRLLNPDDLEHRQ